MQLLLRLSIRPFSCCARYAGVHIHKILFESRREDPSEIDEVFGSQCGVSGLSQLVQLFVEVRLGL